MKPFKSALLAIASASLVAAHVSGARPWYGDTLRVQESGTIASADPAVEPSDDAERSARAHLLPLVFETLVGVDPAGGLTPRLAVSWEADARAVRWRFGLRQNVTLHDGSTLAAWHVASALRHVNPEWTVGIDGNAIVIEAAASQPGLAWELADPRYSIAVQSRAGEWIGSGPFTLKRLESRHLSLRAHEHYWNSRPFVDAIEIDLGRSLADQLTSLELGRADIVSVRQTDLRRLAQLGLRTETTRPLDLMAIVFELHRTDAADERLRHALDLAINRSALSTALLQGYAKPATALLPSWLSGYELPQRGPGSASTAIASPPASERRLTLRIEPGNPLAQAIADRIVVDAREAGISITVQAPTGLAPRPDARLARLKVIPTSPDLALNGILRSLGSRVVARASQDEPPAPGAPIEGIYRFERALVDRAVIVPVVHVSDVYGIADGVESWNGPVIQPSGEWNVANVWLARAGAGSR